MENNNSGFYKLLEDGTWLYAQYKVIAPKFTISRENYEEIGDKELKDGWKWCEEAPKEYLEWKEKQSNSLFEQKNLMLNE